jgi:GNAT superfamily N-acetyltransferase
VNRTQLRGPAGRAAVPIRRARAADLAALGDFFAGLSERTRYLRFFGGLTITPAMLRLLSGGGDVDCVVATHRGGIIGHAMAADRAGQDGTAMTDIGVVVADAWQGQGVGSALVRAIIAGAQARGSTTVAMDVLAGNQGVLAMIAAHWPVARTDRSGHCVTVHARLPRHQEERTRAELTSQPHPGPSGTTSQGQRQPALATALLPVGRSRDRGGSRPRA